MKTNQQVCFISYNSRGFSDLHQYFIRNLVSDQVIGDKTPILCNQENFILRGNFYKILQALPNFHVIINPAIKNSLDRGRPKGGMFIAVPSSMKSQVTDVSPGHWRIQAIVISSPTSKILLINAYFPCDNNDPAAGTFEETTEVVEILKRIVQSSDCDSVLWCGDINTDFRRNTRQVGEVSNALENLQLGKVWDRYEVDFTRASNENVGNIQTSIIDHFFYSSILASYIQDAGVIHSPDNRSDHSPVYCVLSSLCIKHEIFETGKQEPRPNWKAASLEEKQMYKDDLEERLARITIPHSVITCQDVDCRSHDHCDSVDKLTIEVLEAVQLSAEDCLPCPGGGNQNKINKVAGWNDDVKHYRDNAYFWHQVWVSCRRPLNNQVHMIMKRTRNIYHYMFRKCQKAEKKIKSNKMLDSCLNGNGDIFKEIKAIRKTRQVVANSIDGVTEKIPDHFRTIYADLYNSVDDADNMAKLSREVEGRIGSFSLHDVNKVTPEVVKAAAKKLNQGKSDPVYTFSSDCIKVDSEKLSLLLSVIIKCYLIHGHVTRFLLLATLVPLIKDKLGNANSSKNYRSIAISSLILKLLDWIIIILFGSTFGLHDLQFAYQPGISGNMCTYAVLETVDYFLRHGSEVFMCTMDMTKAFDVTVHSVLFKKMLKAGLSPIFLRLMIFIYTEQFANVRWNGEISSVFTMHNGVRQGAILSALAYCFYCEDLFQVLEKRRSGCWVNGFFLGLLGYSDDNVCLAPSLNALQDMLETCEKYASDHNLKFSTNPIPSKCKTKTLAFLKNPRPLPNLYLCGHPLPWTTSCKHLGITIGDKIDGCEEDIKNKNAQYIRKNVELNQEFSFTHPMTKLRLNNIYNSHFYGSPLWNLFGPGAKTMESTYNRSVKIMLDLPYSTHRSLIEPLTGETHVRTLFNNRFLGFMENISASGKKALIMLMETAKKDVRSVTGRNFRNIMLQVGKTSVHEVRKGDTVEYFKLEAEEIWKVEAIKEIIDTKAGNLEVPGFSTDELNEILLHFCTS